MWIQRDLKNQIKKIVETRPIVLLTGARQVGKSSLLKRMFPKTEYVSFDSINQVEVALESPNYFLRQFTEQVILDEIQYVPGLFRELKILIDEKRSNYGKWIITGSQQFELMENISDSLAGRISIVHLETLSSKELRAAGISNINDYIYKGGYPEIWSNAKLEINDFFESYIKTYLERDLKSIVDVKNLNDFRRLMRALASRVGQLMNYKNLSNDIGVSDITIKKWIHALEVSGVVYLLPPIYSNIGKRLIKSPKLYFADHGIVNYLLGIENYKEWNNHIYKGNLWENIVFMELVKTNNFKPGSNLFFYRDQNGVEIDFVVEKKNRLYFIEAKASERVDRKKLNFDKVIPLFQKKYKTDAILALNMPETKILKLKDYRCINPILTNLNECFL